MNKITVNIDKVVGKMRPMHAVNNVPSTFARAERWGKNNFAYLEEMGIPFSRFHDTGGAFGGMKFIDIPNVFPDFDADETNPDNYDFTFTDWLIDRTEKHGSKPFYRLGVTIENDYWLKAYRIYPPKDYNKWARICERIVMHYNEGWANGYNYNIEYWEIWNEPEGKNMWLGTDEEYYELYFVASNYLKKRFPNLKIGGYASCGFYKIAEQIANPEANISETFTRYVDFFHGFMEYITDEKHKSPLDFFSWHSYSSDPKNNAIYCNYVREQLDKYGFYNCENICNEWNPGIMNRGKLIDCARIAANMLSWQKNKLDMAMYYDCSMSSAYCGLFDAYNSKPTKAFYAMKAFNVLYRLNNEVECICDDERLYCCASSENGKLAIMIANFVNEEKIVKFDLGTTDEKTATLYEINEEKTYEASEIQINGDTRLAVSGYGVYLIEIN